MLELKKLNEIEERFEDLVRKLSDPSVIADQEQYRKYAKAHSELAELVGVIRDYKKTLTELDEAQDMVHQEKEAEMEQFLHDEINTLKEKREKLEEELKLMLIAKDPNDEKDIIMEIRAGTGGEEAALFAGELYRMYNRYAENQSWKTEVLSASPSDIGGFKEVIFEVKGKGAYSKLKFESGVHRVQRVPVTESGGRIHTSAATVAVLPEAEEVEVDLNPNDLRIDIFRSSGPGGQSVNTTDSAVRITHLPTGIVVSCQEERSQLQNRERALKIVRARLYEKKLEEQQAQLAQNRKLQVGTGDRSEKIRTYNYPQNRVTDHRINFSSHNLPVFLEGELGGLIEALIAADRAEKLKAVV